MKKIELTQGKFAIVDDDDYEYLKQYKWFASTGGKRGKFYAVRGEKNAGKYRLILMHRVINNTPNGMVTDHINLNTLDNRKANLRSCSTRENSYNRPIHKNNKLGYKGVYVNTSYKGRKKYKYISARIIVNNRRIHLGNFDTIQSAAKAYNKAALKYHGEYAQLNKVA